jgi:hypothetical protein
MLPILHGSHQRAILNEFESILNQNVSLSIRLSFGTDKGKLR